MEDLSKAKIITRNGVPYYADGKHAGKRVGSIRTKKRMVDETSQYNVLDDPIRVDSDQLLDLADEVKNAAKNSFKENNAIFKKLEKLFDDADAEQKVTINKLMDKLNQRM